MKPHWIKDEPFGNRLMANNVELEGEPMGEPMNKAVNQLVTWYWNHSLFQIMIFRMSQGWTDYKIYVESRKNHLKPVW